MLHFDIYKERHKPKVGTIVWLMPIRYWEPDDYKPIKFEIKEVSENGSLYGYHYQYGCDVYITVYNDFEWFYSEKECRRAQRYLTMLHQVVSRDDVIPVVDEILNKVKNKKNG